MHRDISKSDSIRSRGRTSPLGLPDRNEMKAGDRGVCVGLFMARSDDGKRARCDYFLRIRFENTLSPCLI